MTNFTQSLKVIFLAIVLSFGISYVFAWAPPTVAPTGGNSTAPLNTSNNDQTKNGNLFLNALGITNITAGALSVAGGAVFGGGVVVGDTTTAVPGTIRYDGVEFLGYTGGAWKSLSSSAYAPGSKTYTTPGTYTFIVPDAVYSISTEVWGAGGGGGWGPLSRNYKGQYMRGVAGSGGGGGYARENSYPVAPGDVITILVGAGGARGAETGLNDSNLSAYWPAGRNVTTGGSGSVSTVSKGISIIARASGGFGGVSHDYNCGGDWCNGMMFCNLYVKSNEGTGTHGTTKMPGGKGLACLDQNDGYTTAQMDSYFNLGGTSGKSTNYLGQPVNAGIGGVGRSRSNAPGTAGQVIIWW